MPGFLYVAHNDEYRADLYKLGYTTVHPEKRIARLNQQVRLANDIGQFTLTHSIAVPTAYDSEQRIFEALQALRVAAKREFFVGPSYRFINALDRFAASDPKAIESLLIDAELSPSEAHEATMLSRWGPDSVDFSGQPCIYAVSNPRHKPNTFRLGWTAKDVLIRLSQMNRPQRRYTSQIGFYRLVHVVPVANPDAAARAVLSALQIFRVAPRRPFLRVDVAELRKAMDSVAAEGLKGTTKPTNLRPGNVVLMEGRIAVTAVSQVHATWAPWSSPCPTCRQQLRFTSQIGIDQMVSLVNMAAACGRQVHIELVAT